MAKPTHYFAKMTTQAVTADDLLGLRMPGKRTELVAGRLLIREPAGLRHGRIAAELAIQLGAYVRDRSLGRVYAAETGFKLATDPDTVRAPDVAFISRERAPDPEPEGYPELAPDLVAEVLSPGDRPGEVLAKVADWLNAGSRLVWVVDPRRRFIRVYRQDGSESVVTEDGTYSVGEDVVPGFTCRADSIL